MTSYERVYNLLVENGEAKKKLTQKERVEDLVRRVFAKKASGAPQELGRLATAKK